MANVRCPMCSKTNPADLEQCAFCGARLKPLGSETSQPPENEPADDMSEDVPEWLRSLRTDEDPEKTEGSSEDDAGDSADWLSRIRNRAQTEIGEPADAVSAEEETPDWLTSLSDEPSPEQQPGEANDWMSKLSGFQPEESDATPPAAQSSAEPEEDFSWLSGFQAQEGSVGDLAAAENQPAAEKMPWEDLPSEEPGEGRGFGLTGFLTSIESDSTGQEASVEKPGQSEPVPSIPDFSADVTNDLPEWLGGEPPKEAQFAPEASEGGSELPEWLQSLGEEPAATSPASQEEQLPEWLGTGSDVPDRAAQEQSADLPMWLGGAEPEEAQTPQQENLPEWLAGFSAREPDLAENAAVESTDWSDEVSAEGLSNEPDADLPAWLKAQVFADDASSPTVSEEPAEQNIPYMEQDVPQAEHEAPFAGKEPAQDKDVPDWFSSFEDASSAPASSVPLFQDEETTEATSDTDVPEWLRDFDTKASTGDAVAPLIEPEVPLEAEPVFEGGQPFAMDLPDWLSEDSSQAAGDTIQPSAEAAGDELAQADLPDWVKEMRPIESIIPGAALMAETERKTEKSGPLAGMNGILPAEELASRYSKPPVYTVKLQVSEKQRGQAAQLDTILAQETQPLLIPPQGKSVQGLLLRILVALVLITALSLPPLMGMQPLATPALYPAEIQQMYEQIENAQSAEAPVLLAVDFEPGMYGEMRLASLPVLEHLIAKNSRIVVISTRANGAALAQNLLAAAADGNQAYLTDQVENLGFLPGDTISLLAFAGNPAFAAPANLGGELVWQRPSLQGISTIRDFSRVIVLTDTAETGRAWVEQVQPQMGDLPLLMVTSAQAAPMMVPFVQSNQVSGMVAGQMGGVLYAQWAHQDDSPVLGHLASYQVGILLAFTLALLGGLFSAVKAVMKRGQKEGV